jgi:hypothetical protein
MVLSFAGMQPAFGQWTMEAYIGWAAPFKANVRIDSPTHETDIRYADVRFETKSFEKPLYYGLRAGRMWRARFGAEIELTHLKIFADVDTPVTLAGTLKRVAVVERVSPRRTIERLNVSHGLNMVLVNFVTRFPVRSVTLTARFGAGPTLSHTEAIVLGETAEHYEPGGAAMHGAGGIEIPVHGPLHILGEYKYTTTWQDLSVGSTAVELTPVTHHLLTGIALRF